MPLDTPVLELGEILFAKSGGSIDKEVYAFKKGDNDLCMRYDLTVPLARFVAMNADNLTFPFKRFQIGKVFRGEKAQKGRFREFIQCDADIIGQDTLPIVADAECLFLVDEVFKSFNLNILNRVSNRNILFGYCEELALKDKTQEVLIILDKMDKIGKENALNCLKDLGIPETSGQKLLELTSQKGSFDEVLKNIENFVLTSRKNVGMLYCRRIFPAEGATAWRNMSIIGTDRNTSRSATTSASGIFTGPSSWSTA